jgi:hypothetical protein
MEFKVAKPSTWRRRQTEIRAGTNPQEDMFVMTKAGNLYSRELEVMNVIGMLKRKTGKFLFILILLYIFKTNMNV